MRKSKCSRANGTAFNSAETKISKDSVTQLPDMPYNSPKDPVFFFSSAHFFGVRMTKKPADQPGTPMCRSIAAFSASAHLVPYLHVGVFSGQN